MPSAALARPALAAAGASHTGLQRENNEDRFHCDPARGLFVVIDGVGGHAAGEKAAETALAIMRARLERETGQPADRVREAITLANNEIVRLGASEPSWAGMACVLTAALVRDGRVTVGHVGDTRLYALGDAGLVKITHDHSPIGEREDQGEIDEHEAMSHPRRNEIYRDVGSERHEPADEGFIELIEQPFEPNAALLLCTDGLSDMLPSARIARILLEHPADPAAAVERLIEAANQAGGKDNVTAIVVMGPGFAEAAGRRLRAASQREGAAGRPEPNAWVLVKAALTSRPAIFAYGAAVATAVIVAIVGGSGFVAARVAEMTRPPGWTRTWRVGVANSSDFATIQEALQRARPGDVVLAEPGSYDLPLVVPRGISVVSSRSHEAALRPAASAVPGSSGVQVMAGGRLAGFKIESPGGVAVRLGAEDGGEATLEDLEIVGASEPAVVFGPASRGVLRGSYVHDNGQVGVLAFAGAHVSLLQNVVTGNGKGSAAGARPTDAAAKNAAPAIVLQEGASATLFGNVVAGNANDEIRGLPADKKADVLRDNVIGLPPPARPSTPAKPAPRRPDQTGRTP